MNVLDGVLIVEIYLLRVRIFYVMRCIWYFFLYAFVFDLRRIATHCV